MKCYSRSSLGVIIGILNILIYLGCVIVVIGLIENDAFDLKSTSRTYKQRESALAVITILFSAVLSVCILMAILSGLLIMGIVKRRHKLMWPWLAVSALGFTANCIRVLMTIIVGFANGVPVPTLLILLLAGVFGVGIHALIIWPIYTLCRDIQQKNKEKHGQLINDIGYGYIAPESQPPPVYNCKVETIPKSIVE